MGSVLSGMERPVEHADALRTTVPNSARMYDYYLGGKDNYAADRALAERVLARAPVVADLVRANRAFLRTTARDLAARTGIRQFLDLGCGLPARDGSVGDVVRRVDPRCRIAYADIDPMVVSHARALVAVDPGTAAAEADARDPRAVLAHPELARLLDPAAPMAVFLMNVLHFLRDDENPGGVVAGLLAALPPGSRVVYTHAESTPELDAVSLLYTEADLPLTPRPFADIEAFAGRLGVPSGRAVRLRHSSGAELPIVACVAGKAG